MARETKLRCSSVLTITSLQQISSWNIGFEPCTLIIMYTYLNSSGVQKLLLLFGAISSFLRHAQVKDEQVEGCLTEKAIQAIQGCLYSVVSHIIFHGKSVRMQIGNLYDKKKMYKTTVIIDRREHTTLHLLVERWLLKIAALYSKDWCDYVLYGITLSLYSS